MANFAQPGLTKLHQTKAWSFCRATSENGENRNLLSRSVLDETLTVCHPSLQLNHVGKEPTIPLSYWSIPVAEIAHCTEKFHGSELSSQGPPVMSPASFDDLRRDVLFTKPQFLLFF